MKNGQKLKLGDATMVSPHGISKRYKRQSLGMPKASPSSSIKSPGLSRHFVFIVSCTVVLFLERLSFCLLCLVCLVWFSSLYPCSRCVILQISCLVLERSSKFLLVSTRGACIDCDLESSM